MKLAAGNAAAVGHDHIIKRPRLTRLLDETEARSSSSSHPPGTERRRSHASGWPTVRTVWYRGTTATADVAALALGLAKAALRSYLVPASA